MILATALAFAALALNGPDGMAPEADALGPKLANVRSFAAAEGDRLWPGYGRAPFGFLLLGEEKETLLCRDAAPDGFSAAGTEAATGCARFTRPRGALPADLLAAMPLFGPPSTIVMGSPEATGRGPGDWLHTILHEHFHQWQSSLPDYYARAEKLDLAGGDETGMWMLNFPFPYEDAALGRAYEAASAALADALAARGMAEFPRAFDRYLAARAAFATQAGERNWRYIELQLWQEGVARWTEIMLGKAYPDQDVRAAAAALEGKMIAALRAPDLAKQKRELAYPFGAGEAWLMQACGDAWRMEYPQHLALGPLLRAARVRCGTAEGPVSQALSFDRTP